MNLDTEFIHKFQQHDMYLYDKSSDFIKASSLDLEYIKDVFRCPDKKVAASLFFKRFKLLSSIIYSFSINNVVFNTDIDNWYFSTEGTKVKSAITNINQIKQNREELRTVYFSQVFKNINNIIDNFQNQDCKVRKEVFYEHMSFSINFLKKQVISDKKDKLDKFEDDLNFIINNLEQTKDHKGNNMIKTSFNYFVNPDNNEIITLRNSCCLNFRLRGDKFCYTCPALTYDRRIDEIRKKSK